MKIALLGKSRAGKDSVANLIKKHSPYPMAIVGFGDALKEHCTMLFPKVDNHLKPREMYEKFGEDCRQIYEDVWVDKLHQRIEGIKYYGLVHDFIINDLRQPNEWNYCFQNGYTIIKVEAEDNIRTVRSFGTDSTFKVTNHSERFIDELEYDFVIYNNHSEESLERKVIQLIKIMEGGLS